MRRRYAVSDERSVVFPCARCSPICQVALREERCRSARTGRSSPNRQGFGHLCAVCFRLICCAESTQPQTVAVRCERRASLRGVKAGSARTRTPQSRSPAMRSVRQARGAAFGSEKALLLRCARLLPGSAIARTSWSATASADSPARRSTPGLASTEAAAFVVVTTGHLIAQPCRMVVFAPETTKLGTRVAPADR